ncbi:cysteine desulfurase [Strigomonas culicis]|nr:cysteine desulfurase [Strigomonas culicis]|eukprot:EPY33835.1 cysteine desulfurase [Strigomonas culicis]
MAPVNAKTGRLDADLLERFLTEEVPGGPEHVALVTVMFANNELGSVNPIQELVKVVKRVCGDDTLFHSDAAQALGKVPVHVHNTNVDLLSVCGHKFYAPKGSGALYIKPGVTIRNVTFGAGHERGIRPGTENVLLATGMAEALRLSVTRMGEFAGQMRATRDELARVLRDELAKNHMDYVVNGDISCALPNTLNCAVRKHVANHKSGEAFTYISAQRLIIAIGDQVCISAGSACHSTAGDAEIEVSAPLRAVGVDLNRAIGTLRISTGRDTTIEEVRRAARIIARQAAQQFAE